LGMANKRPRAVSRLVGKVVSFSVCSRVTTSVASARAFATEETSILPDR
jgi:hypothetical protein